MIDKTYISQICNQIFHLDEKLYFQKFKFSKCEQEPQANSRCAVHDPAISATNYKQWSFSTKSIDTNSTTKHLNRHFVKSISLDTVRFLKSEVLVGLIYRKQR